MTTSGKLSCYASVARSGEVMANPPWWMTGIIYEIYPRSFQDSNNDGIGDLQGIQQRLPYLSWLGIDAIWIAPIYPSPMADFGYDVSDYCDIDPIFGSLSDFDVLLHDAHARKIKVILDFVPNHTSDQHSWFKESRSSRQSERRDWYIWRDAKSDGSPPNNWVSQFGGPAWTFDPATDQYYLHSFLKEQPDLNWRNADVRSAMYGTLRFWLDRGVDGFRVDVLWLLIKDALFRDNPSNPNYRNGDAEINRYLNVNNGDQPEVHQVTAEMRSIIDEYEDRLLIGEIYLPLERLIDYYGNGLEAHLPFNFLLVNTPWNAPTIAHLVQDYENALSASSWPNWVLGNHDQKRIAARVGEAQARVAAMMLLTLRGTPTMYYGDELGLAQVAIASGAVQDPWGKREPGLGLGRDPSRTPFQWDESVNAGFTKARPWLPVDLRYRQQNVALLKKDPDSLLSLYRELIAVRRRSDCLSTGHFRLISANQNVFIYERFSDEQQIMIALNFGLLEESVSIDQVGEQFNVLLSTHLDRSGSTTSLRLRANEGIIFLVPSPSSEFAPSQQVI
jgi:alpha-glucosidase